MVIKNLKQMFHLILITLLISTNPLLVVANQTSELELEAEVGVVFYGEWIWGETSPPSEEESISPPITLPRLPETGTILAIGGTIIGLLLILIVVLLFWKKKEEEKAEIEP